MPARKNGFITQLRADKVILGASTVFHSPTVIEVCGDIGLDYIFIDLEHSGPSAWDTPTLEALTRAADAGGVSLVVRLPSGNASTYPPLIRKVLDAGVRNIVIPRIESATEVRHAVEATQFSYDGNPGERGVGVARGSTWGSDISADWITAEDEVVRCGIMIENQAAVEAIDDILAVPNLGFVFIGSMDLSVSLGLPTAIDHPEFDAAVDTIVDACTKADVPFGQMGVDLKTSRELVDRGAQLVTIGSDLDAIRETLSDRLTQATQ